jgi:hypothetical protein
MEGFDEFVAKAWETKCPSSITIEVWQFKVRLLRKRIKGWSRNIESGIKKNKQVLIDEVDRLDKLSEVQVMSPCEKENRRKA